MDYARDVAEELVSYIRGWGEPTEGDTLSDYVDLWIKGNDLDRTSGITLCGGDYDLFLRAFVFAIARFIEQPEDFGEMRHHIRKLVRLGANGAPPECLDRDYWQYLVFANTKRRPQ